jgi:hypothetical protein
MIYGIIGLSLLFVAIGFSLTENNAKYLLSGYNTMREEDRNKVDIKAYVPYFRRFHIFLGVSFLLIGSPLSLISENASGVFLGTYPILAYIYFLLGSSKYSKGLSTKWSKVVIYILAGVLIFVIVLFALGFKEDRLIIHPTKIEILGSYGEEIIPSEIKTVELVDDLPRITMKVNGFALGAIKKGYFKTKEGEKIKLILNSGTKPYLLITKINGGKIYFSSKDIPIEAIYNKLKETLHNIVYEQ